MRAMPSNALIALPVGFVLVLGACSDQRQSAAEQRLRQEIADQSSGALALTGFTKTNGYEQGIEGMTLYILEWEARLEVQTDIWKQSQPLTEFYWPSFSVMRAPPSVEDQAWARFGGRVDAGVHQRSDGCVDGAVPSSEDRERVARSRL